MTTLPEQRLRAAVWMGGSSLSIELRCRKCGELFTPSPDAIRAGPQAYWYCETCRPAADAGEKPVGVWQSIDELSEAHSARFWRSPAGDVEFQTCYSRRWGDAIRAAIPQPYRTWHRDRQVWRFDAMYAEVALDLAAQHFLECIELDVQPTRARRPMTEGRAYTTLALLEIAPLAVAEASYAVLSAAARATAHQRELDEAIAMVRWRQRPLPGNLMKPEIALEAH